MRRGERFHPRERIGGKHEIDPVSVLAEQHRARQIGGQVRRRRRRRELFRPDVEVVATDATVTLSIKRNDKFSKSL